MTTGARPVPAGWEGILDPGEEILWQGRPGQGFHMAPDKVFIVGFGLLFAGFALFWMVMAAQAGGFFWMFGLIHFSAGVGMIGQAVFGSTIRRRGTWYTLSNRRAFIATDLPWRAKALKSYPIRPDTELDYRQGDPATIVFARELRRGNKGRAYNVDIGFERIAEGDKVMRLIRGVQARFEGQAS